SGMLVIGHSPPGPCHLRAGGARGPLGATYVANPRSSCISPAVAGAERPARSGNHPRIGRHSQVATAKSPSTRPWVDPPRPQLGALSFSSNMYYYKNSLPSSAEITPQTSL